jgi:hypothetical protein
MVPLQGTVLYTAEMKSSYIKIIKESKPRFYILLGKKVKVEVTSRNDPKLVENYKNAAKGLIDSEVSGLSSELKDTDRARKIGVALRETLPKVEGESFI